MSVKVSFPCNLDLYPSWLVQIVQNYRGSLHQRQELNSESLSSDTILPAKGVKWFRRAQCVALWMKLMEAILMGGLQAWAICFCSMLFLHIFVLITREMNKLSRFTKKAYMNLSQPECKLRVGISPKPQKEIQLKWPSFAWFGVKT